MALPEIRGTVKLLKDPKPGVTATGKRYCNAFAKFETWKKIEGTWEEGESVITSLSAWEDLAETLAAHVKGDKIDLIGTAKVDIYNDKAQLRVTLSALRPHEGKA